MKTTVEAQAGEVPTLVLDTIAIRGIDLDLLEPRVVDSSGVPILEALLDVLRPFAGIGELLEDHPIPEQFEIIDSVILERLDAENQIPVMNTITGTAFRKAAELLRRIEKRGAAP